MAKRSSEIVFAAASVSKIRTGKRLTRSLFRQVRGEKFPQEWMTSYMIHNQLSEEELREGAGDVDAEVLGYVNYFWKGCGYLYDGNYSGELLHVLWLNKQGELRRSLISNSYDGDIYYELTELSKPGSFPQLFLGDFCT